MVGAEFYMSKTNEELKFARMALSARGIVYGAIVSAQGTVWGANDSALDNALHCLWHCCFVALHFFFYCSIF